MKNNRKYHGWIVVEDGGPGFKDYVFVEYRDKPEDVNRFHNEVGRGESGCASAVEWWEKRLGTRIKLEPMLRGSFRVYTESEEVPNG